MPKDLYIVKLTLKCKVCGKVKVIEVLNDEISRLISEGVPIKLTFEGYVLDSWICSNECSERFFEAVT